LKLLAAAKNRPLRVSQEVAKQQAANPSSRSGISMFWAIYVVTVVLAVLNRSTLRSLTWITKMARNRSRHEVLPLIFRI
jgi:hypothetical protein